MMIQRDNNDNIILKWTCKIIRNKKTVKGKNYTYSYFMLPVSLYKYIREPDTVCIKSDDGYYTISITTNGAKRKVNSSKRLINITRFISSDNKEVIVSFNTVTEQIRLYLV